MRSKLVIFTQSATISAIGRYFLEHFDKPGGMRRRTMPRIFRIDLSGDYRSKVSDRVAYGARMVRFEDRRRKLRRVANCSHYDRPTPPLRNTK
tara:strand:- start:110 stop:388 length:279 start_codon:yes stop_codon:yes gene_type:complete